MTGSYRESTLRPIITEGPSLASSIQPQLPARSSTPVSHQHQPRGSDTSVENFGHPGDTINTESSVNSTKVSLVDPTNIAAHGKYAYLPDDSALSHDFHVSHGSGYFDLDEVARPENPEDRDVRSIVGEGNFEHIDSVDMYKHAEAWPSLAEDSLEEYAYNTNQLERGTVKVKKPLDGIIQGKFLNLAGPSVGSDMSHPYRQHNRKNHTYYAESGANIYPVSGALGMNEDSLAGMSESFITMHHEEDEAGTQAEGMPEDDGDRRGRSTLSGGPPHVLDTMQGRPTAQIADEGSSEVLNNTKVSLSNELSHASKVFPFVEMYQDGSNASKAAVEAHWSLSLKSLPNQTEHVHMTTSQGVKLVYTSLDSRLELRRPEWKLRPHNELTLPHGLPLEEGETSQQCSLVLPGGKIRATEGQSHDEKETNTLQNHQTGLLMPSVTSSIATGDPYHQFHEDTRPIFNPKRVVDPDERIEGEAEKSHVVEEKRFNEGLRIKREDDDASIDHKIIRNDDFEKIEVPYLPLTSILPMTSR